MGSRSAQGPGRPDQRVQAGCLAIADQFATPQFRAHDTVLEPNALPHLTMRRLLPRFGKDAVAVEKGQDAFLVGRGNCEAEKAPGAGDTDVCHRQRLRDIGTRDRAIQPGGQGAVRDRAGGMNSRTASAWSPLT